jgi:hypothetical protein
MKIEALDYYENDVVQRCHGVFNVSCRHCALALVVALVVALRSQLVVPRCHRGLSIDVFFVLML